MAITMNAEKVKINYTNKNGQKTTFSTDFGAFIPKVVANLMLEADVSLHDVDKEMYDLLITKRAEELGKKQSCCKCCCCKGSK